MTMVEQSIQKNIFSIESLPTSSVFAPSLQVLRKSLVDETFYMSPTRQIKTPSIIKKKVATDTTFQVRQRSYIDRLKHNDDKIEYSKTRPCTIFLENRMCHRKICGFAHCKKEINPRQCNFTECNRQYQRNLRRGQTICVFKHINETVDEWSVRIGIDLSGLSGDETVVIQKEVEYKKPDFKCTQLCKIVLRGESCTRTSCGYAHTREEYRYPLCMNGDRCYKKTTCMFKHPSESEEDFNTRRNFEFPSSWRFRVKAVVATPITTWVDETGEVCTMVNVPPLTQVPSSASYPIGGSGDETVVIQKEVEYKKPDFKCTQLCKIVLRGESCTRTSCGYAHTREEYRYPLCMNGDRCYKKTTCMFKHPSESEEDFNTRRNFEFPYSFPYSSWVDETGEVCTMVNVPPLY